MMYHIFGKYNAYVNYVNNQEYNFIQTQMKHCANICKLVNVYMLTFYIDCIVKERKNIIGLVNYKSTAHSESLIFNFYWLLDDYATISFKSARNFSSITHLTSLK